MNIKCQLEVLEVPESRYSSVAVALGILNKCRSCTTNDIKRK